MKIKRTIALTSITAELLDEDSSINLIELSRLLGVHAEFVIELIEQGALEPLGENPIDWQFDSLAINRSLKAVRLYRDLKLEPHAIPLILDLLEELQYLRERVSILEKLHD